MEKFTSVFVLLARNLSWPSLGRSRPFNDVSMQECVISCRNVLAVYINRIRFDAFAAYTHCCCCLAHGFWGIQAHGKQRDFATSHQWPNCGERKLISQFTQGFSETKQNSPWWRSKAPQNQRQATQSRNPKYKNKPFGFVNFVSNESSFN